MAITEKYVTDAGAGTGDGSSEANARSWANMVADINGGGTAGNRYNVKGAISRGATDTISGSGSATSPVIIRGYSSVIGDGNLGRTSANGPLITTNMPAVTYASTFRLTITGTFIIVESLNVTGSANGNLVAQGSDNVIKSCRVVNANTGANAVAILGFTRSVIYDCDPELSGASGGSAAVAITTAGNVRVVSNRIKGGPAAGINLTSGSLVALGNVIYASGTSHIVSTATGGTITAWQNTLVGATADGANVLTGTTGLQFFANNMATDNGGYGFNLNSAAVAAFLAYNRTRDNTSGAVNLGTDWAAATSYGHVTTDTGGPETDYTNAAGNDYTLVSTSPAKGAGWFSYADVGALQRQEAAGGGGGGLKSAGGGIGMF